MSIQANSADRNKLLEDLEQTRGSRVLVYATSDRDGPFNARIAPDVIRPFFEHLRAIGKTELLDILVYSQGGDTIVPWRLVNLAREFAPKLAVLVPFKAHSSATLLALGADEIVMGPMGELSPIDPSIGTPFNPPHPDNPSERKQEVAVEDVAGFLNLAKERVGLTNQDALVRVFEKLADQLHPLALGGVYRSHALIRALATKMLSLHMKGKHEEQRIPRIVDDLAERLYYHGYLIGRSEADDLGLKVVRPTEAVEELMWGVYLSLEGEMELGSPFDPDALASRGPRASYEVPIAILESHGLVSRFSKTVQVVQVPAAPPPAGVGTPQLVFRERSSGWVTQARKVS